MTTNPDAGLPPSAAPPAEALQNAVESFASYLTVVMGDQPADTYLLGGCLTLEDARLIADAAAERLAMYRAASREGGSSPDDSTGAQHG